MIELEGLAKTYADGTEALRGVSLALDQGMFGLLGPNGAGKTTFLSILVLALEPSAGRRCTTGSTPPRRRSGEPSAAGSAISPRTTGPSPT